MSFLEAKNYLIQNFGFSSKGKHAARPFCFHPSGQSIITTKGNKMFTSKLA
jgi:hypothetical protein